MENLSGGGRQSFISNDDECLNSWVLGLFNESAIAEVEEVNARWKRHLSQAVEDIYNEASPGKQAVNLISEPDLTRRFDVMMPAVDACPNLKRIGNDGEGGKLLCGLDVIPDSRSRPCIVYSIGSNDQWDFEEGIFKDTQCKIYTFDCTTQGQKMPRKIRSRTTFHSICLGDPKKPNFMSLKGMMEMLGHTYVTLLKVDIVSTHSLADGRLLLMTVVNNLCLHLLHRRVGSMSSLITFLLSKTSSCLSKYHLSCIMYRWRMACRGKGVKKQLGKSLCLPPDCTSLGIGLSQEKIIH